MACNSDHLLFLMSLSAHSLLDVSVCLRSVCRFGGGGSAPCGLSGSQASSHGAGLVPRYECPHTCCELLFLPPQTSLARIHPTQGSRSDLKSRSKCNLTTRTTYKSATLPCFPWINSRCLTRPQKFQHYLALA